MGLIVGEVEGERVVGLGVGGREPSELQYPQKNPSRRMGLNVQISVQAAVSRAPLCIANPSPKTHLSKAHTSRVVGAGVTICCLEGLGVSGGEGGTAEQDPHSKPNLTSGTNAQISTQSEDPG